MEMMVVVVMIIMRMRIRTMVMVIIFVDSVVLFQDRGGWNSPRAVLGAAGMAQFGNNRTQSCSLALGKETPLNAGYCSVKLHPDPQLARPG